MYLAPAPSYLDLHQAYFLELPYFQRYNNTNMKIDMKVYGATTRHFRYIDEKGELII